MTQPEHNVRVGQVWRDLDPRGGPTFVVVEVDESINGFAIVTDLSGKRRRQIRVARIRPTARGYELVKDAPPVASGVPAEGPSIEGLFVPSVCLWCDGAGCGECWGTGRPAEGPSQ